MLAENGAKFTPAIETPEAFRHRHVKIRLQNVKLWLTPARPVLRRRVAWPAIAPAKQAKQQRQPEADPQNHPEADDDHQDQNNDR